MKILFTLAMLMLAGCSTPYQSTGIAGGFTETQLDKNVFRVAFVGNGFTRSNQAEDFALLRSAELTLKHGFKYFAIVNEKSEKDLSTYTTPRYSTISSTGNVTTTGGHTNFIAKPSSTMTIVCFNEKPSSSALVYDAEFIHKSIGGKYGVVKPGTTQ